MDIANIKNNNIPNHSLGFILLLSWLLENPEYITSRMEFIKFIGFELMLLVTN
jgi:hypothetical protein